MVTKAKIMLALCDSCLNDEMEKTRPLARDLERAVYWGNGELEALMAKPGYEGFAARAVVFPPCCIVLVGVSIGFPDGVGPAS